MTDYKPSDYHTVTPYLVVDGAERLITFIVDVLDGTEIMRIPGPDGRLGMRRSASATRW